MISNKNNKFFYETIGLSPVETTVNKTENGFDFSGGAHILVSETAIHQNYQQKGYPFGKSIRGLKKFARKSSN